MASAFVLLLAAAALATSTLSTSTLPTAPLATAAGSSRAVAAATAPLAGPLAAATGPSAAHAAATRSTLPSTSPRSKRLDALYYGLCPSLSKRGRYWSSWLSGHLQ